jgi:5-(carboxyamino)imidazole ribonucleotide synthase
MLNSTIKTNSTFTLGILGGGQLAKMLALSAYRLGLNVAIIENHSDSPAGDMTKQDYSKGWRNDIELEKFIETSDIITLENEFIDPEILDKIALKRQVYPSADTMRLIQDKFIQKETFLNAGLPLPLFEKVESIEDLKEFGKKHGFPFVVKARKYGYDGYGNATVFNEDGISEAWNKFNSGENKRDLMVEKFVDFTKELAVIVARNAKNETEVYPCVETVQYRHICHEVISPAEIDENIRNKARQIALSSVNAINGVGVFGVELFMKKNGEILINEIAPRPHNSGHYTIESCYTSQFENCIRAVCGLPLGSSKMIVPAAVMINLLGIRDGVGVPENVEELLRHRNVFLHLYNKKSSRSGRKMGHITSIADTQNEARTIAKSAADSIVW